MKFDLIVYIGRFQPFHNGHLNVLKKMAARTDECLILLGSHGEAQTARNPFTSKERGLVVAEYASQLFKEGNIVGLPDYHHDGRWSEEVRKCIEKYKSQFPKNSYENIGIIGNPLDSSYMYQEMFPELHYLPMSEDVSIHATDVREFMFGEGTIPVHNVPSHTAELMYNFMHTDVYDTLRDEYFAISNFKDDYSDLEFPPIFQSVDSCIFHEDNVLLVRRGGPIGAGLYAMPGGFVEADEPLWKAAIRELREETNLSVPESYFENQTSYQVDTVGRSQLGRMITNVFKIVLNNRREPIVTAGDDAEHALWFPVADLKRDMMYDDHYYIINDLWDLHQKELTTKISSGELE